MKIINLAIALILSASIAQADLLARWEVSEEAIREQVFVLHGNGALSSEWSNADRRGKGCLLVAMQNAFGANTVEGYINHLESTAAQRMSFGDPFELSTAWARAAPLNHIGYDDVAPLALACNTSF